MYLQDQDLRNGRQLWSSINFAAFAISSDEPILLFTTCLSTHAVVDMQLKLEDRKCSNFLGRTKKLSAWSDFDVEWLKKRSSEDLSTALLIFVLVHILTILSHF